MQNAKGTQVQLVWKQITIVCLDEGHSISMVVEFIELDKPVDKPWKRKRNNPP